MTATNDHQQPTEHDSEQDTGGAGRWLRRRTELGFAIGVFAIAVFITVQIPGMPPSDETGTPGPGFFPILVAAFLYITAALLAINVIRNPRHTAPSVTGNQMSTDLLEDIGGIDDTGEIRVMRSTNRRRTAHHDAARDVGADAEGAVGDGQDPANTVDGTRTEDQSDADDGIPDPPPPTTAGSNYIPVDYRTVGIVLAGLVGFILLLQPLGWLLTASALFWLVCYALGSKRPIFDIAVSVIFASAIQLAFSAGLGLSLPPGIMEGLLPWSN